MLTKKDGEIIAHLRRDARKKITAISSELCIPATTIYDRVRLHQNRGIIKRNVALLDFPKMGLHSHVHLTLKVKKEARENLELFLMACPNINSLYRVNFEYDYVAEALFKSVGHAQNFIEQLDERGVVEKNICHITQELKREKIMTNPNHLEYLGLSP